MDKNLYTQKEIREYLLGSLTGTEAERFDELSFTDESFAEDLKAAENELIDNFVNGELADETLEKFKSHYLASPRRREKVEFARSLQIFAGRNSAEIKSIAVEEKKDDFFAALAKIFNSKPLQIGFAAALLLLFAGGLWLVNYQINLPEIEVAVQDSPTPSPNNQTRNSSETEIAAIPNENIAAPNIVNKPANKNASTETNRTPQTEKTPATIPPKTVIASIVLAPALRGANQLKTVSISKETTDVAVGLQLESDDYASYRVALTDEAGGKTLWQSSVIKTRGNSENKTLNIRFPAKLVKPGVYSFVVSGNKDGAAENISNYTFRVVVK